VRVKWLRTAIANLKAEAEYISRDSPAAAARTVAAIAGAVALLETYPSIGRPGRVSGTRELVVPGTPYIIPYRVRRDQIELIRVFHGARKWPDHFE
jgi:toxin ParE1/3/4